MRKVMLNVAVSLDGLIEGPNGDYSWCFTDADYGMNEFLDSVDTVILGRKSYDVLLDFGPPYPDKKIYVFTRTEKHTTYQNVKFVEGDIPAFVSSLIKEPGKDIFLFGGAEIIRVLLEKDLVDGMLLSVHPIILGSGLPLFSKLSGYKKLKLSNSIKYPSGLMQLHYLKE